MSNKDEESKSIVVRLRPERRFSLVHDGKEIWGPDEESVKKLVASLEEQKRQAAQWPKGSEAQMAALGALFPSLRGVPGVDPWNADAIIAWAKTGAPTSGSIWAARFLLSVWNSSTDWAELGLPPPGRFDLFEAWGSWDSAHRAAALRWLTAPFHP